MISGRDLDLSPDSDLAVQASGWTQRVGALTAVPRLLRDRGVEPAAVLAEAGLGADALDDPERRIPYAAAMTLLSASVRATGLDHFGILAGAQWHLPDLGLAGRLARASATLGEALRTLAVYLRLNNQGATAYVAEIGNEAEMGYLVFHPGIAALAPGYDTVMASAVNQLRELIGLAAWQPSEVLLPRSSPADERPYSRHFGCRVRFNADRACLRFPARELERPMPGADARLRRGLLEEADRLLGEAFLLRILASLRIALLHGTVMGDLVAQQLAMHRRTLQRRLEVRGTSFQRVLDQVRFDVARQFLRETDRSVTDIAMALGFAEASTFTRAFRRWAGVSPSAWRERAGA